MTLDLSFTAALLRPKYDAVFMRTGHVGRDSAVVLSRTGSTYDLLYRPLIANSSDYYPRWRVVEVIASNDNDQVSRVVLKDLQEATEYEYKQKGASEIYTFTTDSQGPFSFITSSCLKPNFPYIPGHTFRLPGMKVLGHYLDEHAPHFGLFLGDWVYAKDHTIFGKAWENYHRLYRQTYSSSDIQPVLRRLPMLHIYDDHEVVNNFAGDNKTSTDPFKSAHAAYRAYNGAGNSPILTSEDYFDFTHGNAAFFVMDTRRYRSQEDMQDGPDKTMLGPEQKQSLKDWASRVNHTHSFKIISSSVPFTSLWHGVDGEQDTWGGYRTERQEILDFLAYTPNVIMLTGDRHEFAAVQVRNILEVSTSPLSQFYFPIRSLKQSYSAKLPSGEYEEKLLAYFPDGNVKFTVVHVRNDSIHFELFINHVNSPAWTYTQPLA